MAGHAAYRVVPGLANLPSVGQFLEPAGYVAWGMFYILWKQGGLSGWEKILLVLVLLPIEFLLRLASGLLAQVLALGIFLGLVILFWRGRPPVVLALATCGFVLVMSPVKLVYRAHAWEAEPKTFRETISDALFFLGLAREAVQEAGDAGFAGQAAEQNLSRISHIFEFDHVVRETPAWVPYWGGETYKPLLTKLIPRILWPGKPEERFGQEFGHRYGFLHPGDEITSVNMSWLTEMYANFGRLGVLAGMAVVGVALALVEAKFNRPEMTPLEFVVGAAIVFGLPFQESNFSLMIGGIVLLALSLVAWFHIGLRARF